MNPMPKRITASAPGKVIIAGEHFVVHGSYAVAAAISKRVRVSVTESRERDIEIISRGKKSKLDSNDGLFLAAKASIRKILDESGIPNTGLKILVSSDIPSGSGLGSSAAVSVATCAALTKYLGTNVDPPKLAELALQGERAVHGNPSGVDIHASLVGGLVLFNRNSGVKPIPLDRAIQFLVVYSGKQRKTFELIRKVSERRKQFPSFFEHLTQASSFLSLEVVDAATGGDLPYLGALMNLSQASLSWIGVSTRNLDRLIERALGHDAFGAKITGAGGGGSIIVLPKPERVENLLKSISERYRHSFVTSIPQEGLRWEN